jgi:Secretion system C-terminal sorting domain
MNKLHIFLLTCCFCVTYINAQPAIEWQKSLGGSADETANSVFQTSDGGFIIAGQTFSNDGDVAGNHSTDSTDFWVIKLGLSGNIEWQKCLGGAAFDCANSVLQTSDGDFVVAGHSRSSDGDITGNHGGFDAWIVKLSTSGSLIWQQSIGENGNESALSLKQTNDDGFIICGYTDSNEGQLASNHGGISDAWVAKLNTDGQIEWQKCFGGSNYDIANNICQTAEGDYLFCGSTKSTDGDITANHGEADFWVVKLGSFGEIIWQHCFGGTNSDFANDIKQTEDGGIIVSGSSESIDGDISQMQGIWDSWVLKLTASGVVEWQKSFGGSETESAISIQLTKDVGYIVAGFTESSDGDVGQLDFHGASDIWVVKMDQLGALEWKKCLGGTNYDLAAQIFQTADEGFIVAGLTESEDGDISSLQGITDAWVVKLTPLVRVEEIIVDYPFLIHPNPVTNTATIEVPEQTSLLTVSVYDVNGGLINTQTAPNQGVIDFSTLPKSNYIVKVASVSGKVYTALLTKN